MEGRIKAAEVVFTETLACKRLTQEVWSSGHSQLPGELEASLGYINKMEKACVSAHALVRVCVSVSLLSLVSKTGDSREWWKASSRNPFPLLTSRNLDC